jgi:hypothetical protein
VLMYKHEEPLILYFSGFHYFQERTAFRAQLFPHLVPRRAFEARFRSPWIGVRHRGQRSHSCERQRNHRGRLGRAGHPLVPGYSPRIRRACPALWSGPIRLTKGRCRPGDRILQAGVPLDPAAEIRGVCSHDSADARSQPTLSQYRVEQLVETLKYIGERSTFYQPLVDVGHLTKDNAVSCLKALPVMADEDWQKRISAAGPRDGFPEATERRLGLSGRLPATAGGHARG